MAGDEIDRAIAQGMDGVERGTNRRGRRSLVPIEPELFGGEGGETRVGDEIGVVIFTGASASAPRAVLSSTKRVAGPSAARGSCVTSTLPPNPVAEADGRRADHVLFGGLDVRVGAAAVLPPPLPRVRAPMSVPCSRPTSACAGCRACRGAPSWCSSCPPRSRSGSTPDDWPRHGGCILLQPSRAGACRPSSAGPWSRNWRRGPSRTRRAALRLLT